MRGRPSLWGPTLQLTEHSRAPERQGPTDPGPGLVGVRQEEVLQTVSVQQGFRWARTLSGLPATPEMTLEKTLVTLAGSPRRVLL